MAAPNTSRWLTIAQAADLLAVSPKHLSRWAKQGRLTANGVTIQRTLGGHRRFLEADILALRDRLTFPANQEVR